jgi:hypothetical protein
MYLLTLRTFRILGCLDLVVVVVVVVVVVDHKIKKRLVHFAFDNSNLIFFYGRLP